MKVPLNWVKKYIEIENTPQEFGDILTKLEFLQNGPVENADHNPVIDLEVRQNRPDMLSIIGPAREYAAYKNKSIQLPKKLEEFQVDHKSASKMVQVIAKNAVKRFFAVQINDVQVSESPDWIKEGLKSYGTPVVNNIVDITNYVMLEYGIPMHAFDLDKLPKNSEKSLLTLRMAEEGEELETWLGEHIRLTHEDLVVADAEDRIVSVGGISGEKESGISDKTKNIILESANYDYAAIRRTSLRHNLVTDSALRHSKYLSSEMVEIAIKRALFLIFEIAGGEITAIDDFYERKDEPITIDFNTLEVNRLGGVEIKTEEIARFLDRLGIEVIEQTEALGLDKNILKVRVPMWRTDLRHNVDLVEEVLRLWGYDNIPVQDIDSAPPEYSTPKAIQTEAKIRVLLTSLGLDEHITNPVVEYDKNNTDQIKLENPLSQKQNALRITIRSTLIDALSRAKKAGHDKSAVFEVGKIYKEKKIGEYAEESRIEALYSGYRFADRLKPDFLELLKKLGLNNSNLAWESGSDGKSLKYYYNRLLIALLYQDGFVLMTQNISKVIDLSSVPAVQIQTTLPQKIAEEISLLIKDDTKLGEVAEIINGTSDYIKSVELTDLYKDIQKKTGKVSATFKVVYEDTEKKLTREEIDILRNKAVSKLQKIGAKLR